MAATPAKKILGGGSRPNYVFAFGGELMVKLIEIAKPLTS
jgi:hypothetical protein